MHAVAHGRLDARGDLRRVAVQAHLGRWDREHLVVADVRARCHAREAPAVHGDAGVTGRDPGDMRAVPGVLGVERLAGVPPGRRPRREGPGHDHLRVRVRRLALREAGRHRVAARREEGVVLLDAVVHDPDAHPVAGRRQVGAPERRRADHLRRAVEAGGVARRRPDARHARDACELAQTPLRHDDREAVEHDAVAPAHAGAGDALDAALDLPPAAVELAQVAGARGRAHVDPAQLGRRRQHPARAHGGRERGPVERDDHLHAPVVRPGRRSEGDGGGARRSKDETPHHAPHST